LLDRVTAILFRPSETWETIAAEFTTTGSIYKKFVLPMALIPAGALIVGSAVWGRATLFGRIKIPWESAAQSGAMTFALWLVAIVLLGVVISALAGTFGGSGNTVQGVKVAAYSATPALLAGLFVLLPTAGWLRLVGLYSLYLIYTGLPPVMKAPKDRVIGYAVVAGIAAVVVYLIIDLVTQAFLPQPR
jgi:hypothetical protein